ncbi:hypothetical protein ANN_16245 [Periplaneta americana]|uniref:Uncharacterized protein n=1 Tax=Periplaneta americana TaxID=6978 RepID=A0ABQ8SJT4_PERAM|nr:hypothetical protein ANN_16245 [Periplaneta americana]
MAEVGKQAVSFSAEKQLNKGRKRKINIHEWKDDNNKALRNAGKPYMSRKEYFVSGKCVSESFSEEKPNRLRTRASHNILQPWQTYEILETHKRRNKLIPLPRVIAQLYNGDMAIKKAKKVDLLHMCEFIPPQFREFYQNLRRLRVFENKVLRKIFGVKRDEATGEWRKLHNAELHALYPSPDIIRNIKSRHLRWAGHVARMGESRNAYRVLVGRPEGKRPLGRPRRRWEDNIKMDLREVGYDDRDWINLAQDRDRWRAYVRAAMNLRVVVITDDVQNVHLLLEYRPHIDVSLTCKHDPKLQEYCVCPQNMPQFDSEGIPNQAPETNKPIILNGPTSRGFRSGERGGQAIGPPLTIHRSGNLRSKYRRAIRPKCAGAPSCKK